MSSSVSLRHILRTAALVAGVACFAAPSARANLIGDTVSCAQVGGGTFACSTPTATVGGGTEFLIGNGTTNYIAADFNGSGLSLTFLNNALLSFTILDFKDLTTPFSSYSLVSQTGISGFDASKISLVGGTLEINLRDTNSNLGDNARINLVTSSSPTPEPGSFFLLGTGALGIVGMLRRRFAA